MKKSYLLFILVLFPVVSSSLWAANRDYAYVEIGESWAVGTHASRYTEIQSTDPDTGAITTNPSYDSLDSKLFDAQYNSNILVGYHFYSGWSFEFEMASYDIAFDKVNGETGNNGDAYSAYARSDYDMINIKYDLFSIGDFTFYTKAGTGIIQVNFPYANAGDGGSNIEPAFQFVGGFSYALNNAFDIGINYKFLFNIPSLEEVAAVSAKQRINFKESAIYLTLKVKM